MKNSIIAISLSFFTFCAIGQIETKKYLKKNKKAATFTYGDSSIYARGLYIDSNRILIGNSNGALFMKKSNNTEAKLLFKLPDFTEMRDIEKSNDYFIGMQSGNDGKLVRMSNDGSIRIIQHPSWEGRFFDGIDFQNELGFLMGDPVDGFFTLFHTDDSGLTWNECEGKVKAFKDEAGFAASGSNVQILNDSTYVFVTGGMKSRFIKSTDNGKSWVSTDLPYYPGLSTGAYSMCFSNDSTGVIVGGDYTDPDIHLNTTFFTYDGGDSWFNSPNPTRGYRSCVFFEQGIFYACGRNGIDFSFNQGVDWIPFANGTFFSLGSDGEKLYATTKYGKIKVFNLIESK